MILPVGIAILLGLNLAWSIVRANLDPSQLDRWPYRLVLTDTGTAAGLLGASVSLILGRLQWAHANRPALGFGIDDESLRSARDSHTWVCWLFNAGPGMATVRDAGYRVALYSENRVPDDGPWVSLETVNNELGAAGLVDGEQFHLLWVGSGYPLAPTTRPAEGSKIGWFTIEALSVVQQLDMRVVIEDSLGDHHEMVMPLMDRMPSVAREIVAERRKARQPTTAPSATPESRMSPTRKKRRRVSGRRGR